MGRRAVSERRAKLSIIRYDLRMLLTFSAIFNHTEVIIPQESIFCRAKLDQLFV